MEIIKGKLIFKVAYDQIFNPLYVGDLKKIVRIFLKKKIIGTFNVGGPEQLSRLEVLKLICQVIFYF